MESQATGKCKKHRNPYLIDDSSSIDDRARGNSRAHVRINYLC